MDQILMGSVWKCDVCGYVHEGEAPPDVCPACGVDGEMFSRMTLHVIPTQRAWRCTVCGYIHYGDRPPEACPVCGAASELFELEASEGQGSVATALQIVVVGAGIAGTTAIDHARRAAPNAALTLVSAEAGMPYYRLNLTRLLAGEIDVDSLIMANAEWFASRNVELVHGNATAIDREGKRVLLGDGRALPYDRLVLALGAQPFVPPLPGKALAGVFALRSLVDAQTIIEEVSRSHACAVLGGGLLGLEAAAAVARRGLPVTVVESQPWLLPRQLAERPGRILQAQLARMGVAVRLGARTRALGGIERVGRVEFEQGDSVAADLVIVATGVRPELTLVRAAGLEVKAGAIVDDRMVTSDASVLAAGDVTEHRGRVGGIWPVGYAQGRVAGHNAAVGPDSDLALRHAPEPPATKLKVVTTSVSSVGEFAPTDSEAHVFEAEQGEQFVRVVLRGDWLVGANLLGDARLASELEGAIERGASAADLVGLSERFALLKSALAHRVAPMP